MKIHKKMGTLYVKYRTKKQLSTLKKLLSALDFEIEESDKNPSPSKDKWFENPKNLEMIKIGEQQLREGKGRILTKELRKELFG